MKITFTIAQFLDETTEKLDGLIKLIKQESEFSMSMGMPITNVGRELAAWKNVKDLMGDLEKARLEILYTHEKDAEELAIAAGFGVSEWDGRPLCQVSITR